MNHLRRAHARASLSAFRSANMAMAADEGDRADWVSDNAAVAGW